jgi:hypothetical protein
MPERNSPNPTMKPLFTFASDVKRSDWIYHAEYADSAICPLLLCAIKVLHSHAGVGFRGRAVDVTSREGPQSTHCGNSNIDSTLSKLGAGTLGKSGASLVQVRRRHCGWPQLSLHPFDDLFDVGRG